MCRYLRHQPHLRKWVLLPVLFLTLKEQDFAPVRWRRKSTKSTHSYRSSYRTRLGSKNASKRLLRQWPPRRLRLQILNKLLGALWLRMQPRQSKILVQECEMFRRRHKYEKSSMHTVISTTTSHKAKRDDTQLSVVTHEYADAMRVPEHYANTLHTRALGSVTSRMMSKCRTRQLESCDTLSAFFHAWLEKGVRVKPPKDPRLGDGWCGGSWRERSLLSPGVSGQWSPGSARMVTDARRVENCCGQEVEAEFQSQWPQAVQCAGTRIALFLEPDRFDLQFATKELTHDVQTPSMLSMLKPRPGCLVSYRWSRLESILRVFR